MCEGGGGVNKGGRRAKRGANRAFMNRELREVTGERMARFEPTVARSEPLVTRFSRLNQAFWVARCAFARHSLRIRSPLVAHRRSPLVAHSLAALHHRFTPSSTPPLPRPPPLTFIPPLNLLTMLSTLVNPITCLISAASCSFAALNLSPGMFLH